MKNSPITNLKTKPTCNLRALLQIGVFAFSPKNALRNPYTRQQIADSFAEARTGILTLYKAPKKNKEKPKCATRIANAHRLILLTQAHHILH